MTNLKRHMQHKQLQGLCTKIDNDAVNNTVKLKERIS